MPQLQFTRGQPLTSTASSSLGPRDGLGKVHEAQNPLADRTWKSAATLLSSVADETNSSSRPAFPASSWKTTRGLTKFPLGREGHSSSLSVGGFRYGSATAGNSSASLFQGSTPRRRDPLNLVTPSSEWSPTSTLAFRFSSRLSTSESPTRWRSRTVIRASDTVNTTCGSTHSTAELLDETQGMKETTVVSLGSTSDPAANPLTSSDAAAAYENAALHRSEAVTADASDEEGTSGTSAQRSVLHPPQPPPLLWLGEGPTLYSAAEGSGVVGRSVSEEERLLEDQWKTEVAQRITLDAEPVVPPAILRRAQVRTQKWRRQPSHIIVLFLLQRRGLYYPRNRDIYNYHMASSFLYYLDICREGSYFVHYTHRRWPKERFFRLRLCTTDWYSEEDTNMLPFLVATVHKSGVTIVKSIPLHQLVGVSLGADGPAFTPLLCGGGKTIQGCVDSSGHRATFPTAGAFRLQFYDEERKTTESVDLLTCDPKVFDIWTKTFSGIVSVNSSSVIQVPLTEDGYNTQEREALRRVVLQRSEEEAFRSR